MENRKMKKSKNLLTHVLPILFLFVAVSIISWTNLSTNSDNKTNSTDTLNLQITEKPNFSSYISNVYQTIGLHQTGLAFPVFEKAITGFINLKRDHQLNKDKEILTVIDFSKSSTEKRMWIIDLKNKSVLLNTYVAHGRGSGDDMANKFSNVAESHQSSLGFYVTNETYFGKHGLSLKLDGLDRGINNLARSRAIVVHGASYVSESFINNHGRLGRSHGCPAVPEELNKTIIELIKDKTCMFINGSNPNYRSVFLDKQKAENILLTAKI
ncbi:murein L,D-transpeptidase catalytic domain family protein [Pseudopedobacter sp.]|uniref:murein L,D-transpeptidase catalytic domain family protein n=1 Tax=Pseudopedobacter sp. TaxID=1936787 RepID=UPI00333EAEDA